jgi:hypothetical protein
MDTEMEYLPINNIKQELEPTTSADANENSSNSNQAAPDSVENKVSEATPNYHYKKPHVKFYATSFRCRLKFRFPSRDRGTLTEFFDSLPLLLCSKLSTGYWTVSFTLHSADVSSLSITIFDPPRRGRRGRVRTRAN